MLLTFSIDGNTGRVWGFKTHDPRSIICHPDTDRPLEERCLIGRDYQLDIVRLINAARKLVLESSRVLKEQQVVTAIAVSVAGKVNPERTQVVASGRLTHWFNQTPASDLSVVFDDCPVILGNDAEAGALAEAFFGTGVGYSFLRVLWQDGIGACHIIQMNGRPYSIPSEMGHMLIDPTPKEGEPECGCNEFGCLESLAGGWSLRRFAPTLSHVSPQQWDEVIEHIRRGIYNSLLDVQALRVIIGGSIPGEYPHLVTRIRASLSRRGGILPGRIIVSPSSIGENESYLVPLALFEKCHEYE